MTRPSKCEDRSRRKTTSSSAESSSPPSSPFSSSPFAALLATRCGDVGTVPSRIDVHCHPDYTSATKKTPTPLNGRCTRMQIAPDDARSEPRASMQHHSLQRTCARLILKNPHTQKMHMPCGFLSIAHICPRNARRTFVRPFTASSGEPSVVRCVVFARCKKIFHSMRFRASRKSGFDQKRANRA